jgi:hypothetical protein
MAYGDRINAIKQDWVDDINQILNDVEPIGHLVSLNKMSSNDLIRLHTAIQSLVAERDAARRQVASIPTTALNPSFNASPVTVGTVITGSIRG